MPTRLQIVGELVEALLRPLPAGTFSIGQPGGLSAETLSFTQIGLSAIGSSPNCDEADRFSVDVDAGVFPARHAALELGGHVVVRARRLVGASAADPDPEPRIPIRTADRGAGAGGGSTCVAASRRDTRLARGAATSSRDSECIGSIVCSRTFHVQPRETLLCLCRPRGLGAPRWGSSPPAHAASNEGITGFGAGTAIACNGAHDETRRGICIFVSSLLRLWTSVIPGDGAPTPMNPNGRTAPPRSRPTGRSHPTAANAAPMDGSTGCWPVGMWTFTAAVAHERLHAGAGARGAVLSSRAPVTQRHERRPDRQHVHVSQRPDELARDIVKVSEGGSGPVRRRADIYSTDGKIVWLLKPELNADNTITGDGEYGVFTTDQWPF